jgi:hypothetical protein
MISGDGNAWVGGMNARLERKLPSLAANDAAGLIAGIVFNVAQGRTSLTPLAVGATYGLLMSASLGSTELLVLEGPMREWLGGLSFAASLLVRSAIYLAIITVIQWFQLGEVIAGVFPDMSSKTFWSSFIYSAVLSVLMNLALGVTNIIGPRAFLNLFIGRYHAPVEEKRFVLFVDIAGSTGLAERLGGIAIHRLLDRTFRLLTVADYRGEVTTATRSRALPDVATVAESGVPGYETSVWWGFLGPAGMAPELVAKINADLLSALRDPAVLAAFDKLGAVPVGSSPQDFEAFMRAEAAKWGPILKQANVRIE